MQEQRFVASNSITDPFTDIRYTLRDGEVQVIEKGKPSDTCFLSDIGTDSRKKVNRFYLKFIKKSQSLVSLSPQGTLLTSKSDRIQEVDLNITLQRGQIWWEIFVPHTTLFLTVGVKDSKHNVISTFDFCLKNSSKLQFKLNVDTLSFKTWINGVSNEAKPAITLQKGYEWTPFIRIRQLGASISITSLVSDPEQISSELNPFCTQGDLQLGNQNHQIQERDLSFKKHSKFTTIQLIGNQSLLLSGQNEIKLLKRSVENHKFNFDKLIHKIREGQSDKYLIKISQQELSLLLKSQEVWGVNILGAVIKHNAKLWISHTKQEWISWVNAVCVELDRRFRDNSSKQLANLIYRWILSKIQVLRDIIDFGLKISSWNAFDTQLVRSINRNSFHSEKKSSSLIQSSLYINNTPYFSFSQSILSIAKTQNYVFLKFATNKISVFSTRTCLFKVGDFIISKAIKKENQLTQYKKQADENKDNDFTKPSIYKILKNCLKYADKVKPPEKLLKELQQKKALIKQKEKIELKKVSNEIIPDKELQNTLIQMGFDINIAKKALIECKNSSLQAAMDLILSGNLKVEPAQTLIPPKKQWTCQTCTLVNAENVAICIACDSPAPMIELPEDKKEVKPEIVQEIVEQQVKSEKIEEQLKEVFSFETNIGLAPLIIGGVFNSHIRFRLFCLNPHFYSTFYEKGDAYANLIDNTLNEYNYQLTTNQIEKLSFAYYDQIELKQKCFAWIPLEDYDLEINECVKNIRYQQEGFNRETFTFRAFITFATKTKCLTFKINTSNVYQEKKRSFTLANEAWIQADPLRLIKSIKPLEGDLIYENCSSLKVLPKSTLQFEAYFAHESKPSTEIKSQLLATINESGKNKSQIHLSVIKSPQPCTYPNLSFISPWKQGFKAQNYLNNSLVLGHLQNFKLSVDAITLEIANKEDKLSGFIYFSNDYQLQPLNRYRFLFEGNNNILNLVFEGIQALYVVIVLEPHNEDKLIELSSINVYGSTLQNASSISQEIKSVLSLQELKVQIFGVKDEKQVQLNNYTVENMIVSSRYDLSLLDSKVIRSKLHQICPDIKLIFRVNSEQSATYSEVILKSITLNHFKLLSINASSKAAVAIQNNEELEKQFNRLLDQYLISSDKNLLQALISQKFANFKQAIKNKQLKSFIMDHIVKTPFNANQKLYFQIFINNFAAELRTSKSELGLENLITFGLRDQNLTAFGLEILLYLNKVTNSVNASGLLDISLNSLRQIKEWKITNKCIYNPYEQKTIFSPYIHRLFNKEQSNSSLKAIDRIHQKIVLKKHKFNRQYIIDFFSVHQLRSLDLIFESSKSKNKMIVTIRWVDQFGDEVGSLNHFVDYPQWTQLVQHKDGKSYNQAGILTVDLRAHHIQTRYLIIDCNFTLKPLNGSKPEIQNLADRDIIPLVYGNYIGQQEENLQFYPDFSKNARFICRAFNFNKYAINRKGDCFYYEEEELKPEQGDIASLSNKLELRENKDKWVKIQMANPTNNNINFHFTLVCSIAEEISKMQLSESEELPKQWINNVVHCVAQDEYLPIQELAIKALKHILHFKTDLHNSVLNCEFKNPHIIPTFFDVNPLLSENERKFILKQLQNPEEHKNLAFNCLSLIKTLSNQKDIETIKELGIGLLRLLNLNGHEQQICQLCKIFGWIEGTENVFQNAQSITTKKILAKASKSNDSLIEYLANDLAINEPSENFWIIFEELITKKVNINQINKLIEKFLQWTIEIRNEDESDVRAFSLFERFIKTTDKLAFEQHIAEKLIKIYFSLDNRVILLSQFLKSHFLETSSSLAPLLEQVIDEISIITSKKSSKIENEQQLSFLVDIFSFIYKQEEKLYETPKNISEKSYKIAAEYLQKEVNIGGIQGCRHIKESQISKIALGYYLVLTFTKGTVVESTEYFKFSVWLILNFSANPEGNETTATKKFRSILSNIWTRLKLGFNESQAYAALIANAITQILDEATALKDNRFLANIYRSKVYAFLKQIISQSTIDNKLFFEHLLKKSLVFRRILQQIKDISVFETNQNELLAEKELANNLKLLDEQKPKDWIQYKHGEKQHVYSFQFNKGNRQFKSLTFQSTNLFWLSELVIGFQFHLNLLAPKEIALEIGESLDDMKIIGNLQYIPLQSYLSHSIKVYAINLHRPANRKWHLLRNKSCRFARIIIKSPYSNSLFETFDSNLNTFKETCLISFLSISGYQQNGSTPGPNDVHQLVDSLEILSSPKHKQLLASLLQEDENIQKFQQSLLNLSYLMGHESYGLKLHKFLMRVCELNIVVGNKMLQEYLQLKNSYLFSKIAAEIAGSNLSQSGSRASRYFEFIMKSLQSNHAQDILPFVNRFTQLASILHKMHIINSISSESHIQVSDKALRIILQKAENDQSFRKLAKLILSHKKPLIFQGYDSEAIYESLYLSDKASCTELLASLITAQPRCASWFIEKNYLSEVFKTILIQIKNNKKNLDAQIITNKLRFLTILCQNSQLKQLITHSQYDLKIFEILVGQDGEKLLSESSNKQLRERLVEFIARASLGTENERIIGALLKDSLGSMILESSQQFVAEIFLPLLNSYSKTAVSLLPFNRAQSKLLTDLSGLKIHGANQVAEKKVNQTFKLASQILEEQQRTVFFEKIKENAQHKWGAFKLVSNHGKSPSFKNLEVIRKQLLKGGKSALILIQAKNKVGFFYNLSKEISIEGEFFGWTRGSFAFEIDEKNIIQVYSYVYPKEILLAHEHIGDQSGVESDSLKLKFKSKNIAEIYFDGVTSSVLSPQSLKDGASNQKQPIQSVEYWTFDAESISSYESVFVSQESFAQKLLSQLNDYSFFKTELKADNSLSLLRQEPLYEFPSSITLTELKKSIEIFGYVFKEQTLNSVKVKNFQNCDVKQTSTLEELTKKSTSNDLILDLLLQTDCMPPVQPKTQPTKVEYLPIKGILKYFEENDGVKAMIKVIKKSIGEWKNPSRKQKWEQYSIELENFSAFPHFFSAYLKDKDTFKLLIDLLAGLPDKETDAKWDQLEVASSQKLLRIVSDILSMDRANEFRNYALKHDFMSTILERLRLLTGIFKRHYKDEVVEEVTNSPSKKQVDDDGTKKIKKKKGVGYGNDTNSNTKWMKGQNLVNIKKDFENIETILTLVEGFLNAKGWKIPDTFLAQLLESSLLPYIEDCLRAGTLLEISKHPQKFKTVLKLIRSLSKQQKLISCLLPLSTNYQPSQTESIESLLKSLYNISKIFISCLNVNLTKEDKLSQQLANDIIETYNLVEEAIEERDSLGKDENQFNTILSLPLDKRYRELMKDLRFDYIDMKQSPSKIKHHYSSNFNASYTPNHNKMIRLAQELADISTALPHEHTNAVYVRCDKDRVDFMQALIMGSNGTPYGHGAFLFDIYFDDNYPNGPPKVNLTTTGHGKIRFNPNLYSCGKVCLSLLGTWRGSASENWDAKVSTLLQVLLSIQAIIMSEQVYFNEPGFENEQGTEEGEKKNQAYSNIVRYGNVKFAMLENIKNPPKGFESVIRRHFYMKKDEIMQQCRKWLKYAEKRPANYVGLVNDHNVSWAAQFKKSKTQYKEMLQKAIKELEEQLNKLPPPKSTDIVPKHTAKKQKKRKDESKNALNALEGAKLQDVDVSYEKLEGKQLDINDQKVRDRWSRYIGAMGIDAVSKQSKADILIAGLGPFGLEVIKNIVLSGCRKLTLCDDQEITREDLSGGFFYQQEDIGKKRVDTIIHRIRELNSYVKIDKVSRVALSLQLIASYSLVFASELPFPEQRALAAMCSEKKVKFISADCRSAYCRLVNDFGEFTVLDKNGEEPTEVMLSNIEISERGLVTLLEGAKHPFEDGQVIIMNHVEGMNNLEHKDKSINGTLHTIKVINYKSFEIGNTLHYEKYIRNGTAKNIKTPLVVKFRPFEASIDPKEKELGVEPNLQFFDFSKLANEKLVQRCFIVLDLFKTKNNRFPEAWNAKDAEIFISMYHSLWQEELEKKEKKFIEEFAFTCKGHLPPLCAFFGGLAAQQIIKAITQKYKPINSTLYLQFSEIIPKKEVEGQWAQKELEAIYTPSKTRDEGFSIVVGNELAGWIKQAKLFMIGAGAIGCELLKNFAMVGLGTGKQGKIVLTDPDHIENSNLNRQFLFRQKHISKPKSSTAAASILLMNPYLKGHISALLERVSDSTKDIFSNKFFESLTVVANALDNVAARRYVDQRCVENKIPLFESGTLGPKGHVQVIIPYQTESYGSQNDPVQEGQIPHCTLKMFPQETLHCIQWARDNFGKKFTLQPKALAKFLEKGYKVQPDDIKYLNQSLTMVTRGPRNFEDCISYAVTKFYKYYRDDVMQLLYTYPLDAKTKNGEPFWRLPKRPPTPVKCFNPQDLLHCTFVTSLAVLLAKVYQIPYPQSFRTQKQKFAIGKAASQVKILEFIPSDEKAKQILKETTAESNKQKKEQKQEQSEQSQIQTSEIHSINTKNELQLLKELLAQANGEFLIKHEQFQKDDDSNGHIDYIYSMANLRAINYKLDQMDWITTKLKAGRIVPALATTTSCVAGLQTLEICKYFKKIKIDQMRNAYLNLAVPSLQMSEPGQVKKNKITQGLTVTLWDRWEIECTDQLTFGEIYANLNKKYGLFAKGVLQGMSRVDIGKTENELKAFLALPVLEKLEKEENYIDIVVLFTISEGDDKILEGIPPIRLIFKK